MRRSARPAEPEFSRRDALLDRALSSALVLWRNPGIVGALTATAVAFAFVSANALWNQPHPHRGAFFATRLPPQGGQVVPETVIRIERRPVDADPVVQHVQGMLGDLGLYTGVVDGVTGPRTKAAIAQYQKIVGLPVSGEIDKALITRLGGLPQGLAPKPRQIEIQAKPGTAAPHAGPLSVEQLIRNAPEDEAKVQTASIQTEGPAVPASDPRIEKLQAGLKAFGNDAIEIDGRMGAHTRAAIREFQALFGLPETGEPDEALFAKMREVGLTN